ncbi:type II toxin-antitoxin system VapC family toxin [Candidatus Marithioploca araucensis]|uniref:Ribonuclease VapC n=1 Tax=Candidatus Marithioploca araucensis TaxID=70273 RepID=A0ABT7VS48_9GAMM|nr:type II toxin-antitoxin system VapC family toxin [Candidatus Marithioploca araucensis]
MNEKEEYLLDTNNCVYYLNAWRKKKEKWSPEEKQVFETIEAIKKDTTLYMSEATFGELIFGAEKSQNKTKNLERVEIFREGVPSLTVDQEVWKIFGKIKAELSQVGRIIPDMDILIAATAKRYNLVLATNDSDMDNLDFLSETPIDRKNWIQDKERYPK